MAEQAKSKAELADYIIARHNDLSSERNPLDSTWQELKQYMLPNRLDVIRKQSVPDTTDSDALFDSTAMHAAATFANGQLSYITPGDSRWFVYRPPMALAGVDKVKQWYERCSGVVQNMLATSNFYSEIHELYYDDGVYGTYAMSVRAGKSHPLVFQKLDIGAYCIAEDDEGIIDTLYRDVHLTCVQAAAEFGEDNLSEKLKKDLETYRKTGKGGTIKHQFIQAIYPRRYEDRDPAKVDGKNKPWASIWVERSSKHICREGGFDEKPFFAGRHCKVDNSVYGVAPGWIALPDARQLNFLSKQLDALAEVKAYPRMLMPATHEGEIDLRAGGVTYFDPQNPNAVPKEWASAGDYSIGLDRENRKAQSIERAFYVDLFRMFASLDKQMTAREVGERAAEKLVQFSPSFARKTTELLTPMLRAVFGILLRGGYLPPPPREAAITDSMNNEPGIPLPEINYVSRVALAISSMHNLAWARAIERNVPLIEVRPDILDNFNFDRIVRDTSRNDGLPADWLVEEDEVQAMREARAAAQQQMQEQQSMLAAAEAIGKAGSVKRDSMVADVVGKMAPRG